VSESAGYALTGKLSRVGLAKAQGVTGVRDVFSGADLREASRLWQAISRGMFGSTAGYASPTRCEPTSAAPVDILG
jgi:hypothetical protein